MCDTKQIQERFKCDGKDKGKFSLYLHNLEINLVTVIIKGQLPLCSCRKTISKRKT